MELTDREIGILVNAVQNGLLDARQALNNNFTITNNRKHMSKWDFVNTSVAKSLKENGRFSVIPLNRGVFEPIMIFDNNTKNLYTIMKRKNFKKVLSRCDITSCHYIDAMLNNNLSYKPQPNQLSLYESTDIFSEPIECQIEELSNTIKTILNTDTIAKYFTIVIDFSGYTLTSVELYFCSKWLEIIEVHNLNNFIVPSYEIVDESSEVSYNAENELKSKIQIKPEVKRKLGLA